MTTMRFLGALAAAVVLLASGCGGEREARPDLVFVSSRDGDYAIFEMNADGSAQRRLSEGEAAEPADASVSFFQIEPAWSPDGAKIAFSSNRDKTLDIFVMNADGTGTTQITSTKEDDAHPTWSADGTLIAFERNADIFVMSAGGGGVRRISDPGAEESEPAWSPDGTWIAYVRREPGTPVQDVWVMRPDGSDKHSVTEQNNKVYTPAWSPDSARIVYTSNSEGAIYELFTIGLDGKGLRSVVPSAGDMFEPAWSPDGSKIAYQEGGAIFTVELGGGSVERLTDPADNDSFPVWNPVPPPDE